LRVASYENHALQAHALQAYELSSTLANAVVGLFLTMTVLSILTQRCHVTAIQFALFCSAKRKTG
jgi:predicted O-linked N-acetylglucosamine transferase (SPINDLY family)